MKILLITFKTGPKGTHPEAIRMHFRKSSMDFLQRISFLFFGLINSFRMDIFKKSFSTEQLIYFIFYAKRI